MHKKIIGLSVALLLFASLVSPAFSAEGDFDVQDGALVKYNGPSGDVVILEGVTNIKSQAFVGVESVSSLSLPASFAYMKYLSPDKSLHDLKRISVSPENRHFTAQDGVLFSKDMRTLYRYPGGKDGDAYSVPDSVSLIRRCAFFDAFALRELHLPDGLAGIEDAAFSGLCIASLEIPDSVIMIGGTSLPNPTTVLFAGPKIDVNSLSSISVSGSPGSVAHIATGLYGRTPFIPTGMDTKLNESSYPGTIITYTDMSNEDAYQSFLTGSRTDETAMDYYIKTAGENHADYPTDWREERGPKLSDKKLQEKMFALADGYETLRASFAKPAGDLERISQIYDWVTNNMYMDHSLYTSRVPLLSADEGGGISISVDGRGYEFPYTDDSCIAFLTRDLLCEAGIPARVVSGWSNGVRAWSLVNSDGTPSADEREEAENYATSHHWLEAFADGRWILLDPSLDCHNTALRTSSATSYTQERPATRDYFDLDAVRFSKDHYPWEYSPQIENFFLDDILYKLSPIGEGTTLAFPECTKRLLFSFAANDSLDVSKVERVILPDGLLHIPHQAFAGVGSLKSLTIPDSVYVLGPSVFQGLSELTEVTLSKNLAAIPQTCFEGCDSLLSVNVPDNVKWIGYHAFGYDTDGEKIPGFTIYGSEGSAAHKYAKANDLAFVATSAAQRATAVPTKSAVRIDGKTATFDAYNIDGSNFFKLRDLAFAMNGGAKQFALEYTDRKESSYYGSIGITAGEAYTPVGGEMSGGGKGTASVAMGLDPVYVERNPEPGQSFFYHDDAMRAWMTACNIDGSNYFKLRDIAKALDFNVTYDGTGNTIVIDTGTGYAPE
ncbi:MAG: leucine-rich repeat protein [Clostridiales Family XIII bacterium]|nr:leucine-rich repeat protein [Clostridiales Family XIII bacterium]